MALIQRNHRVRAQILNQVALLASANALPLTNWELAGFLNLLITLNVTAAADGSSDATYDVYITSGDGVSEWDICHFPQIAAAISSTPKRFTARIMSQREAEVTTAGPPGVAAEPTAILETETAGSANGAKTLAAGKVRNGPWGDWIGVWVVIAGTAPSITFTVDVSAAG